MFAWYGRGADQAKAEARAGQSHAGNMMRDLGTLLSNPVIVLNLLAFCPLQAVLGAYAFWGPKVCPGMYSQSPAHLSSIPLPRPLGDC